MGGVVGALTFAGGIAATAAPTDDSEASGQFLSGSVAGLDLATIAALDGAVAENPSGANPVVTNPLAASVFQTLGIDLTGTLQLLGPNGILQLGAVNQYGEANDDGSARAASGAVSDQGAISVGGSEEFPSDAQLNLTQLLGPGFESVVADLDLSLGALSATAEATGGTAPTGDYQIAGATLTLDSPAVSGIATTVDDEVVPLVDGAVGQLVGTDGLLAQALNSIGALAGVLEVLGADLEPTVAIDVDLDSALAPVLDQDFGDEGVVINVGDGTVTVDLDTILGGAGSLNGFDPNTEVLDDAAINAILDGLGAALDDLTTALVGAVDTALHAASLTLSVEAVVDNPIPLAPDLLNLDINLDTTVGDVVGGTVAPGDATITIALSGLPVTLPLGDLVSALAGPLNSVLFADGTGLVSTLAGTITSEVTGPVLTALSPVFEILTEVVSLVVNVQEPEPSVADATFTQRALTLSLLEVGTGTGLAELHLASATVRGSTVAAITPAVTVDPSTVPAGTPTTVTGTGYTPDATVTVEVRDTTGTAVATLSDVPTDGDGGFTTPITVPVDTTPGDYTVVGIDDTTSTEAETALAVTAAALTPSVTVDPTTANPGDDVTVDGTGYTPDSTVTVEVRDESGTVVATLGDVPTDGEGNFTTPITIPADTTPGTYTVVGIDDTTSTEAETPLTVEAAALTPAVTVDPSTVPAGTPTTVTGTGYTPDATVTVEVRDTTGTVVATLTDVPTDGDGGFTTPITVPAETTPGDYAVVGIDDTTSTEAETPLTVEAAALTPAVTVDPTTANPGDEVTVDGTGYTPDATVTVEIRDESGAVVATVEDVPTDADGNFTSPITVPADTTPGDYTVVGIDDTTSTEAETPLTVEAAALTPAVTVDPTTVPAGTPTTVTGTGYTPDSTVTVEVRDTTGTVVATLSDVPTDGDGGFTSPITVPVDTAPGDYAVVGIDDTTATEAETPLVVEAAAIEPALTVDPTTANPGDEVTVDGTGYTPDATVTVEIRDESGAVVATVEDVPTDGDGNFTTPITVPADTTPGDYTVVGIDDTTSTEAETPLTIEAAALTPVVTVDPTTVPAGTPTTVTGTGYTPDSTVTVEVRDADGAVVATLTDVPTDGDGGFTTPITVPADATPGDYTVVGIDDTTSTEAETPLTVEAAAIEPTITVDPTTANPGDDVTVDGTGYTPDATVTVEIRDGSGAVVTSLGDVPTDGDGNFTTPITVPADTTPGDYTVVGIDDTTSTEAETPLGVGGVGVSEPTVTVDPTTANPGDEVTVTGEGWPPSTTVTVDLLDEDGDVVATVDVETDDTGSFTTPITVPEGATPGDYTVHASDDTGNEAETPLTVVAAGDRALVSSFVTPRVLRGAEQTFVASGFEPGESVQAVINSEPLILPVATADANGQVSWTFVVPADFEVGPHTGTATSVAVGDSTVASFEVYLTASGGDGPGGSGPGSGSGSGSNNTGNGTGSDYLARTGTDDLALVLVAALLLVATGAVVRLRTHRARRAS
ncbi:choice-of-anchor G family protein [Cellulosimicrobium cellulans]|uniref:choice-of-anchor G family protein n=1 Tax=Cellulosimicrobium cellulans TaxID=1710 RepID=UPI0020982FF2|nr:choice-of-anchor G family protein [Cellulosimicrobium cellulans]MCO7272261.1 choice-of-anchor G family protein [Cellulosimicrobium cellulans]